MPPWIKLSVSAARAAARLPAAERALLFVLLPYIGWKDNTLRVNGTPMRQADIARVSGLSERQVQTIVDSLVRRGVLMRYGHGPSVRYELSGLLARAGATDKEDDGRENFDNADQDWLCGE